MTILQNKLANRLLYLPLDVHEKVLLWLAYKGFKPVSEITVERRNISQLHKGIRESTYNEKSKNSSRIRKWISDAGLYYLPEEKNSSSWHIGNDKNKLLESVKIIRMFDFENEYRSGELFGFPLESVFAYAKNRNLKNGEVQIPVIYPGSQATDSYLKDKYYLPYMFFALRADRVKEDSQVAKKWADTIRSEVPKLAKWHEDIEWKRIKREKKP